MLPVRCQGASLSRLFSSSFFPPLPRHDASWAEHYVADERKERPRGRSICLNHLSERSRSSSRHDLVASRFVRLLLSLSVDGSITIDRGRKENTRIGPIESSSGLEATGQKISGSSRVESRIF